MTLIIIFLIISFVVAFLTVKNPIEVQNEKKQKLDKLINENVLEQSRTYINQEFSKGIIIDEINKKVHLLTILENKCNNYNYEDIIQAEVLIDNNTITSTNRGNQLVGIAVGSILAGGIGAIIGGLSSSKISNEKIRNIELKLTLNDMNNVIFKINFLNHSKGLSKESSEVKNAINSIDKWNGFFDIIFKQQNKVI
jgi:hypothetical protein